MFNPKQTRKIAAVIILVVIVAMVATSLFHISYKIRRIFLMAARKKKRELSEKAQKRIPQRNRMWGYGYCSHRDYFLRDSVHIMAVCEQGG